MLALRYAGDGGPQQCTTDAYVMLSALGKPVTFQVHLWQPPTLYNQSQDSASTGAPVFANVIATGELAAVQPYNARRLIHWNSAMIPLSPRPTDVPSYQYLEQLMPPTMQPGSLDPCNVTALVLPLEVADQTMSVGSRSSTLTVYLRLVPVADTVFLDILARKSTYSASEETRTWLRGAVKFLSPLT